MIEYFKPYKAVLLRDYGTVKKGTKVFAARQPNGLFFLSISENGTDMFDNKAKLNEDFRLSK